MIQKKSTAIDIKRRNRQQVLRYIFQQDSCSRQDIAAELGMSMPTVLANVKELSGLGVVTEAGQFDSTGGRKAAVITRVSRAKLAVGIDITKNHVSMVLVDLAGEILKQHRTFIPYENCKAYYEELEEMTQDFFNKKEQALEKLLGIGISIPGIIDEKGMVITDSHALGIEHVNCEMFKSKLTDHYLFINDANAAGFAEIAGKEQEKTMIYLSLSNSVGGAIFMQGKLYRGSNQRAGEFGHLRLVPGGRNCYCGQEGCMDAYLNAQVLAEETGGRLEEYFERLRQGDGRCEALWKEYLEHLAGAVINLRMAYDCDIILGGYVGALMEPYVDEFKRRVSKLDPFQDDAGYIKLCSYKREASGFGAAMQHVRQYLEGI